MPIIMKTKVLFKKSIFLFILIFCLESYYSLEASPSGKEPIPTKDEVGALMLPAEITPVKAPFRMPQFRKPTFKEFTISISETVSPSIV